MSSRCFNKSQACGILALTSLTHLDHNGAARMVDVSAKPDTQRRAVASGRIAMSPDAAAAIRDGAVAKGDVLAVARVAGIMAAKRTGDLIPLCHPLPITSVAIDLVTDDAGVTATATVTTTGKTGVEMEAMTASRSRRSRSTTWPRRSIKA